MFLKRILQLPKKRRCVDNTDAEKQTGQRCFVCMRVKITNNIYTVQIFYDFEKEKKNSNFCSVFFLKKKPNNCCTSFTSFSVFTYRFISCWKFFKKNVKHCIFICSKTKMWAASNARHNDVRICNSMCARFFPLPANVFFCWYKSLFLFLLQSECVYATKFVSVVYGHNGRHFSYYLFPSIRLLLSLQVDQSKEKKCYYNNTQSIKLTIIY